MNGVYVRKRVVLRYGPGQRTVSTVVVTVYVIIVYNCIRNYEIGIRTHVVEIEVGLLVGPSIIDSDIVKHLVGDVKVLVAGIGVNIQNGHILYTCERATGQR